MNTRAKSPSSFLSEENVCLCFLSQLMSEFAYQVFDPICTHQSILSYPTDPLDILHIPGVCGHHASALHDI